MDYVASIDQGTTSTRCIIFDAKGNNILSHQVPLQQFNPHPGWTEHDPLEIMSAVNQCVSECHKKLKAISREASAIKGITNQRETTIAWNSETGEPLHKAIVWMDLRTADLVDAFQEKSDFILKRSGLPASTYFSAFKMKWLLENVESVKKAASENTLRFGTVDSWLLWNLLGKESAERHITDTTNASRTMLMNLQTGDWDVQLLDLFKIPKSSLPKIVSSSEIYGHVSSGPFKGIPLSGCLGDQQAALVGQRCFKEGQAKSTYGTGCFLLYNTGNIPVFSGHRLLTTVAYKINGKIAYALEGSIANAGSAINWIIEKMKIVDNLQQMNDLVDQVDDAGGVFFIPAFSGLFAPHWRNDARGTIWGMTMHTDRRHILRALFEAIAFQSREVLEAMKNDSHHLDCVLKVDGGISNSDVFMQIQADILGSSVERPEMRECTALGSAFMAGLAVGTWKDFDEIANMPCPTTKFNRKCSQSESDNRYSAWRSTISKSFAQ